MSSRWKEGQSGNPAGRTPTMPPEQRAALSEAKKLNKVNLEAAINNASSMSMKECNEFMKNPEATLLQLAVCSAFIKSIKTGDYTKIDPMVDRTVGPVTKQVNLTGNTFAEIMERALIKEKERKENENAGRGDTEGE